MGFLYSFEICTVHFLPSIPLLTDRKTLLSPPCRHPRTNSEDLDCLKARRGAPLCMVSATQFWLRARMFAAAGKSGPIAPGKAYCVIPLPKPFATVAEN